MQPRTVRYDEAMPETRLVTAEELFARKNDRCELVRGEVFELTPPGGEHGAIVTDLAYLLKRAKPKEAGLRAFAGDPGFLLARDPDTVRAPDLALVRRDRLEGVDLRKYLPLAPDLAVEVVSPGDSFPEVEARARMWLDFGVPIVWMVEPSSRRIYVHRPGHPRLELAGDDLLTGGDVFPAFSVPAREVFDEPE